MDNKELGLLLKEFRSIKKLLQSDIAQITNKRKSAFSLYGNGDIGVFYYNK